MGTGIHKLGKQLEEMNKSIKRIEKKVEKYLPLIDKFQSISEAFDGQKTIFGTGIAIGLGFGYLICKFAKSNQNCNSPKDICNEQQEEN